MKKITIFLLLLIGATALHAGTWGGKIPHTSLRKQMQSLSRIQKIIASCEASPMEKTIKEQLIEYYSLVPNGSTGFKDTSLKILLNRDKSGNLINVVEYNYNIGDTLRTTYNNLIPTSAVSQMETYIKQFWMPSSFLKQRFNGKTWQNVELDSFRFNAGTEIIDFRFYTWDPTTKKWFQPVRVKALNNSKGVRAGFEIDTLVPKGWQMAYGERTDTVYDANKNITALQVYLPDSSGKLSLYLHENYTLNSAGQPVKAMRWAYLSHTWIKIDSIIGISWFDYNTKPLSLTDDFIQGNFLFPTSSVNTLLTGGPLMTNFLQFQFNFNVDTLVFYQAKQVKYTSDSLPKEVLFSQLNSSNIDSTRNVFLYYPDNGIVSDRTRTDSSQNWTGVGWYTNAIDSSVYTYDANNYVQTVTGRNFVPITAKATNTFRDTYIYRLSTGIEQEQSNNNDVILYPNPTDGLLKVMINHSPSGKAALRILNINGQVVAEKMLPAGSNDFSLDLGALAPGMYIFQYSAEKDFYIKQFIKR